MEEQKQKCEICKNEFAQSELFPISLVRSGVKKIILDEYPQINKDGYLCQKDHAYTTAKFHTHSIRKEKGRLKKLEQEVVDSLKEHELIAENVNEQFEEQLTFGERLSDYIAIFGGSWKFIILFIGGMLGWMIFNVYLVKEQAFDPYPFILLNLVLSSLAAIQAPIIMMSQNRQGEKDRLKFDQDYQTNLKAELEIRRLQSRFDLLMKKTWEQLIRIESRLDRLED